MVSLSRNIYNKIYNNNNNQPITPSSQSTNSSLNNLCPELIQQIIAFIPMTEMKGLSSVNKDYRHLLKNELMKRLTPYVKDTELKSFFEFKLPFLQKIRSFVSAPYETRICNFQVSELTVDQKQKLKTLFLREGFLKESGSILENDITSTLYEVSNRHLGLVNVNNSKFQTAHLEALKTLNLSGFILRCIFAERNDLFESIMNSQVYYLGHTSADFIKEHLCTYAQSVIEQTDPSEYSRRCTIALRALVSCVFYGRQAGCYDYYHLPTDLEKSLVAIYSDSLDRNTFNEVQEILNKIISEGVTKSTNQKVKINQGYPGRFRHWKDHYTAESSCVKITALLRVNLIDAAFDMIEKTPEKSIRSYLYKHMVKELITANQSDLALSMANNIKDPTSRTDVILAVIEMFLYYSSIPNATDKALEAVKMLPLDLETLSKVFLDIFASYYRKKEMEKAFDIAVNMPSRKVKDSDYFPSKYYAWKTIIESCNSPEELEKIRDLINKLPTGTANDDFIKSQALDMTVVKSFNYVD